VEINGEKFERKNMKNLINIDFMNKDKFVVGIGVGVVTQLKQNI